MAAVSISTQLPPISIATPSRDAASVTSSKGLLNRPGQNNCFLNSAVQVSNFQFSIGVLFFYELFKNLKLYLMKQLQTLRCVEVFITTYIYITCNT